ncbi:MAG: signal transduction protein [Desulfobulbaceae bacterium]|nr:MAG: signal transduction protein [Desulfobulbaceae bacterium]
MKIKNWMQSEPVTIDRQALLQDAAALMKEYGIRHLPVVDEEENMVGFITESDLRHFSFPSMVEDIPIHQVMVLNPITTNPNASIETAARLIHDYKIGGLPVLDKKKLVGIITLSDILDAFIEVMGLLKQSTRLDVIVNKKGGVEDVTRIIKENKGEIVSVAQESQSSRRKVHYFRLDKCENVDLIVEALEKKGHKVVSVMD